MYLFTISFVQFRKCAKYDFTVHT
uniref:Uncharacterized protein n=1 Tax=Anguilla anguilla TaxID=7936 RepID=A0A0E9TM07_ANGAN